MIWVCQTKWKMGILDMVKAFTFAFGLEIAKHCINFTWKKWTFFPKCSVEHGTECAQIHVTCMQVIEYFLKKKWIMAKNSKRTKHWEEIQHWAWEDKSLKLVLQWIISKLNTNLAIQDLLINYGLFTELPGSAELFHELPCLILTTALWMALVVKK